MRNPYIVGRWVRGSEHYGRQRLIDYLLGAEDSAIWVVGTRRMGKTSLLRQLEWLTVQSDSALVPLFWDLQGCETMNDLDYELFVAVEDETERFVALGIDVESLYEVETTRILRTLQRTLEGQGRKLLLLIDEAEALINVEKSDPAGVARLRKTLQNGRQRTVMTSTKRLLQLHEQTRHWNTSPFLFGFSLVNLWSLDPNASQELILQRQSSDTVAADQSILDDVLANTNRHPYLIQFLCQRLFEHNDCRGGHLRPIEEEDLQPDHLLANFFQIDFESLSPTECQVLLAVARLTVAGDEAIQAELPDEPPTRVQTFLYGMNKLGYLRKIYGQWTIGNEFLRRWILSNYARLTQMVQTDISDQDVESLLMIGRQEEVTYLRQELARLQRRLRELLGQRSGYGLQVPWSLSMQIQETRDQIVQIRREIWEVTGKEEPESEEVAA